MHLSDLANLPFDELISKLRENGVSSFSYGSMSLTLSTMQEKPIVDLQEILSPDPETMPCGHPLYFGASDGSCLQGCKVEEKPTEK